MDSYDKENIIAHLEKFKASRGEWDTYRKKIPADLLAKLGNTLRECRKNGFVNPRVKDEKIVWSQVLGFKRNQKNADECCLCPQKQTDGSCQGQMIYKKEQRFFVPCWIGGN